MAAPPVHGKLSKQGPLATLSNFIHGQEDRLVFNGQQFVSLSVQSPKVVTASARRAIGFNSLNEIVSIAYNNFMDLDGNFRFVNGSPTLDSNIYTGWPGVYDHIVIGYDALVSTTVIKFWSKRYIDTDHVSVDYGFDSINFHPISGISVSWEFDDTIRQSTETIPAGMYVYSVSLGATYTAKYWRIKGFITAVVQGLVTSNIEGKDVDIGDTTGWSSSGTVYIYGKPGLGSLSTSTSNIYVRPTSYTQITSSSSGVHLIDDLEIRVSSGSTPKSGYILINEDYFNIATSQSVTECIGFAYIAPFYDSDYSSCSSAYPCYKPCWAYGSIPESTQDGDIGPHGGVISANLYIYPDSVINMAELTYTSTNSTDLVYVSSDGYDASSDLLAGSIVQSQVSLQIEQVQITEEVTPLARFWETDGSVCVAKEIDVSSAYDVVFDREDDVFYVPEFSSTGGASPGMGDDFSDGDSSSTFNSNRWTSVGSAIYRDDDIECAIFKNTVSGTTTYGNLTTNSYHKVDSDFLDMLALDITTLSGSVGYVGMAAKDRVNNNQLCGIFALGEWDPISASSFIGVNMYSLQNATDGDAAFRNFRFVPRDVPADECEHKLLYEDDVWKYTRVSKEASPTVSDIADKELGDVNTVLEEGFVVTLDKNPDIKDGSYFLFYTNKSTYAPSSSDTFDLKLKYTASSNILQAGVNDGSDNYITSVSPDVSYVNTEIMGYTDNYTTVSSTGFTASGVEYIDTPCLRVRAFDNDGNITTVAGVTDSNGVVLGSFDVIRDYNASYGDYYDKVSVATTGQSVANGGSIFIRVGEDLYKYNKVTLPLTSYENGSNAVVLASGIVPETGVYNFAYDHYTLGGLSYAFYDSGRQGVFMDVVDDNNLQATSYETELDISDLTQPLAWDISDMDVLYFVDSSSVYAFNMDEDSVAFANVSIGDSILPANSTSQTTITAYATNLYGDPLSNKRVYFSITSGGGSLSAASACTTNSGTASVIFTSGTVSGTSVITVTASNDAC